jgi:WD40 repeat protein
VEVDPYFDASGDVVFAAEAAGTVTGLRLSTNELSTSPRGPTAPLTCLASYGSSDTLRMYAGCWDKSVWVYTFQLGASIAGKKVTDVSSFSAHADFVKCLVVAPTADRQAVLISGGADGDVRLWTLEGKPLGKLSPQCRSIECIVIDPMSSPDSPVVFFSTSQREIFQMTIPALSEISSLTVKLSVPIVAHETSVYSLRFDGEGDLWTASADKTAKRLMRENGWQVDTTLPHPDFVRDIITHDRYGLVVTACRDEEVRVWNSATGSLVHVFAGHFEEVTSLALSGDLLLSASIDGTLRRWSLTPGDLQQAVQEAANPVLPQDVPEPQDDLGILTAEEEAELRALMESEEADTLEKMAKDAQ